MRQENMNLWAIPILTQEQPAQPCLFLHYMIVFQGMDQINSNIWVVTKLTKEKLIPVADPEPHWFWRAIDETVLLRDLIRGALPHFME